MIYTKGFNPETGEWNDSLTGDFLWGNTNIGETLSDVMTPFSWSMVSACFEQMNVMPGYPIVGNIGGRAYNNFSVMMTAFGALGTKIEDLNKEMGGLRDEYKERMSDIVIPLPKPAFLPLLLRALKLRKKQNEGLKRIPAFLDENPEWSRAMRQRITKIKGKEELAALLLEELIPYTLRGFWMILGSAWQYGEQVGKLREELTEWIAPDDVDKLLSNVSADDELLASLGPAIGLARLARGEISREAYLEQWGHRGPHESELSTPRPAEDPNWLDQQLAALERSPVDADTLLARRQEEFESAWARFQTRHPRKTKRVRRSLEKAAEAARLREATRSEYVRVVWVGRTWALLAGEMTGLGDDIFHLTSAEAAELLSGVDKYTASIPSRRETHERYKALPAYPLIIRGQFDPFQWAADPNRRSDFSDSHGVLPKIVAKVTKDGIIYGAPGSAGQVEGSVRRLDSPEDGEALQPGEILVTKQTNIGWTHLFPLAKAVVTDVGAALSHAAIVAREMGIPAVVNCGDATTKLKTGDWVRVDGSQGMVEILQGEG
ncbi:MAG: PEP-utilizing enzyme [Anaerolineales bacterium]|jgi:pyruvate,water dikinase